MVILFSKSGHLHKKMQISIFKSWSVPGICSSHLFNRTAMQKKKKKSYQAFSEIESQVLP